MTRTRLAVIGSPISHSKSPRLHTAAYRVLGLPWHYDAREVSSSNLEEFLTSRGDDWLGLSLTMPLKFDVVPMLDGIDEVAALTGAVNTVHFTASGLIGFNTDVDGLVRPLTDAGVFSPSSVLVLGAGATAGSAMTAAVRLGAGSITIAARNAERAAAVAALGRRMNADVRVITLREVDTARADVVINTLPGGAADSLAFAREARRASVLLDVIYDPWPTGIARSWAEVGGRVIPGIEMLLAQALGQVRIFVGGDPAVPVAREAEVVAAMRRAVDLAPIG